MQKNKIDLTISKQGGLGDGIGYHDGKAIFVPYTVPGDKVHVELQSTHKDSYQGKLLKIIEPSKDRQVPPCPYFSICGGCNLQHLSPEFYKTFKSDIFKSLLVKLGVPTSLIREISIVGERSRRRAEVAVSCEGDKVKLGFHASKSHDVVGVSSCLILVPEIDEILPNLSSLISSLSSPSNCTSISLSNASSKIDASIKLKFSIEDNDRRLFNSFAHEHNFSRLTLQYEEPNTQSEHIYGSKSIAVNFSGVEVMLPEGVFLQASKKGEDEIVEFVEKSISGAEHVADLYSGCGTYSFAIIDKVKTVTAFEGGAKMVQVMQNAIDNANLKGKLTACQHNLYKRPLKHSVIDKFDAIIINPPRNGALPQIKQIVKSKPRKIIMISCNPATFARDLKPLLDSGYKVIDALAIDQFYWSKHLEVAISLEC